ncbi:MAG: hypothetical protein ACLFPL_00475 [Candidatus Nanoarchaeia archaeon]
MKKIFLYFPSYGLHKSEKPTSLEIKLKYESQENILSWESVPQAQEEFDFGEYVLLLERSLVKFLKKNNQNEIRLIGASLGGGILHYLLSKINLNKQIKVFLFKPVFLSNLSRISKVDNFKITNFEKFEKIKNIKFSINNCDLYYVFGEKDLFTGKPEQNFDSINDFSKLLILANSTHQSKEDEFPKFREFYFKFLEG